MTPEAESQGPLEVTSQGVTVGRADESARDHWNEWVARSVGGTVFHRVESLEVMAEWSGARLQPLVGYKGDDLVGVFPVFETSRGPIDLVVSPPPELGVNYLGPAVVQPEGVKRRKAEKRNAGLVDAAVEFVERAFDPDHVLVRTGDEYRDPRPFHWNGFETSPRYSYVVELPDSEEALLDQFNKDARNTVRDGQEHEYVLQEAGPAAVEPILDVVRKRHRADDAQFDVDVEFVTTLLDRLPDEQSHVYVLKTDGEFVGGLVTFEHGDTAYVWQGGSHYEDFDLPANELLYWWSMCGAMANGCSRFDLMGATKRGLSTYKSKFGPELTSYYLLTRGSPVTNALSTLYQRSGGLRDYF